MTRVETPGPRAEALSDRERAGPDGLIVSSADGIEPVISVVLPTKNEEDGIEECIDRIELAVEELGVPTEIIVSDSSSDRTPEIARDRGAIVVEPDRPGYGYAYRYAFERARGQYVVIGDADMTYDFAAIPRLLDRLVSTDADLVLGSRLNGEIKPGAMPALHQYVGNPLLTKFLNTFYDTDVSDAHSGFRVLTREALERLDLQTTGMEFASEMIMDASARGLEIEEVPITYHERVGEATLESFKDGWRHVRFILLNAPGYLFSIPGIALCVLGLVTMTLVSLGVSIGGVPLGVRSMIAGGLLVVVGYEIGSFGVFATVATDPIRRPSDPVTRWLTAHVTLERGATAGLVVFAAGASYATYLVVTWLTSGYDVLPIVARDIATFVLIVVGIQTVFMSFFVDMLRDDRDARARDRPADRSESAE